MGKTYALMFEVLDGGVINPIEWSADNLTSDRIILVLDEENSIIWLWHGKMRGLVSRRTALRQAEALKGHGYTIGKTIIGRNIHDIIEIEERKLGVGRFPEMDKANEKFMVLLKRKVVHVGNNVVAFGESMPEEMPDFSEMKAPGKKEEKVVERKVATPFVPSTAEATPQPAPQPVESSKNKVEPASIPEPEPIEEVELNASEYVDEEEIQVPEPPKTEQAPPTASLADETKMGLVIMAVMSKFLDIWVSKKLDGSISIEQMDGPVCTFKVEGGKVKFKAGSFSEIKAEDKKEIQERFYALLENLK
ncbi:MAG: hypothetical protein ACTSRZ_02170 [Promethearchaeota archaeon]